MSIKFTRRAASEILKRGASAVRIKPEGVADAKKAITRQDVADMVKKGLIYAIKEKKNISIHGKILKVKRSKGRSRSAGSKKGTKKARGFVVYKKKIRAQRRILKNLKDNNSIDNEVYKTMYRLVKGGTFQSKLSLIRHIESSGIKFDDKKIEELRHI